jgi:hypothetical protein
MSFRVTVQPIGNPRKEQSDIASVIATTEENAWTCLLAFLKGSLKSSSHKKSVRTQKVA